MVLYKLWHNIINSHKVTKHACTFSCLPLATQYTTYTRPIPSRYNNEQTTKQTKAINNSYIYINISCKCDTNRAGHFTLDAYASRPVACLCRYSKQIRPTLKKQLSYRWSETTWRSCNVNVRFSECILQHYKTKKSSIICYWKNMLADSKLPNWTITFSSTLKFHVKIEKCNYGHLYHHYRLHDYHIFHYNDVIFGAIASQITSLASVYSTA